MLAASEYKENNVRKPDASIAGGESSVETIQNKFRMKVPRVKPYRFQTTAEVQILALSIKETLALAVVFAAGGL